MLPLGLALVAVALPPVPQVAASCEEPPPGALRTPEGRFDALPSFDYAPNYVCLSDGMRLHYVDEGEGLAILLLHGEPTWSYLYRRMIPALAAEHRTVAPDLIGFGRSDKWVDPARYTVVMHLAALVELVDALDLRRAVLVGQDWGGLLGLLLVAQRPERFSRLVLMNTHAWPFVANYGPPSEGGPTQAFLDFKASAMSWTNLDVGPWMQGATGVTLTQGELDAYDAPFPDVTYQAGVLRFPLILPTEPTDPSAALFEQAGRRLADWHRPVLIHWGATEVVTLGSDAVFAALIPGATPAFTGQQPGAGHFIQEEQAPATTARILEFLDATRASFTAAPGPPVPRTRGE